MAFLHASWFVGRFRMVTWGHRWGGMPRSDSDLVAFRGMFTGQGAVKPGALGETEPLVGPSQPGTVPCSAATMTSLTSSP